jgi:hypothetical protein
MWDVGCAAYKEGIGMALRMDRGEVGELRMDVE